jgi:hypothetical protein
MYLVLLIVFIVLLVLSLFLYKPTTSYDDVEVDKDGVVKVSMNPKYPSFTLSQTIINALVIILFFVLANYIFLARLNVRYSSFIIILGLISGLLLMVLKLGFGNRFNLSDRFFAIFGIGIFAVVLLYSIFGGRTYFHAEAYASLITPSNSVFSADVDTIDSNNLPVVDKEYAQRLGVLKLGEFAGLGSEFQVGRYSDILYQGRQYLVAPLEYRDFFKWLNNRDVGTAGFIMIDKVTEETRLINLTNLNGTGLKYVESAYFSQDLSRHVYFNGTTKYERIATNFEIDDDMNPYFVIQLGLPTIFINGGRDVVKIALVNAITGEVNLYDVDEVPSFVDNVYADFLVMEQLNYYGSLREGFLNSIFNQVGVLRTSPGRRTVINNDEMYHFTGLTSAGSDESTVGFTYINTRTKEATLYSFPGATEIAAMNKTLTLIPQTNISSSFPVPLSVGNNATYYLLIKGDDGRIIRHVFMNARDLQVYGIAETQNSAFNNYILNSDEISNNVLNELESELLAIDSYVLEGNTVYWLTFEEGSYALNVSNVSTDTIRILITLEVGDIIKVNLSGNNIRSIVRP